MVLKVIRRGKPLPQSQIKKVDNKVKRLARQVRSYVPEVNYTNELVSPFNTSTSGTLSNLIAIPAQATTASTDLTRLGDKIKVKDIEFRFSMLSVNTNASIRVVAYIDKRNQSTAVTDVFESGTLGATNAPNGLKVHDYEDRYRFIYDKTFNLGESHGEWISVVKKFNFKGGLPMEFLAGSTTVTKNHIKLIVIGSSALPQMMYQSRMHFYP